MEILVVILHSEEQEKSFHSKWNNFAGIVSKQQMMNGLKLCYCNKIILVIF